MMHILYIYIYVYIYMYIYIPYLIPIHNWNPGIFILFFLSS